MNKKWINTKVVFEWDGDKYVEKIVEGYYYDGELSLAVETRYAGNGGGAGGGGGGNGGILVFITSSLAKPRIDDGTILFDVSKGDRGQYGQGGGGSSGAGWGTTGYDGELIKIVM
tara:strand:- start:941 stop:1285 length:345 start_codon:yes stop_codon:yes gene_type:complete